MDGRPGTEPLPEGNMGTDMVTGRNGRPVRQGGKVNRLAMKEQYKLMSFLDAQRDRIDGKLTLAEVQADVSGRMPFPVPVGTLTGALADLGIKTRRGCGGGIRPTSVGNRLRDVERRLAALEAALGLPGGGGE